MEAQAATAEAEAELAEALRRREEARRLGPQRGIAESEIRAAEAQARIAEAKVVRLRVAERRRHELVARHDVYAPFSGVVTRRLAEEGEWVNTGTPVMELVGNEYLRLDLRVPQEHYPYIDGDTEVRIRLDAMPGRPLEGHISAKVPLSETGSRTFLLRLQLEPGTTGITPGMWTLEDVDGAPVATQHTVQVGRSFDGNTELRNGLAPDMRVVVRGNETLREGQPVRVVKTH